MSFDVQAECPSFFEDEEVKNTMAAGAKVNGTTDSNANGQASVSVTDAKEDHLENIEQRQPKLSMRNGDIFNSTMTNHHYAQSFIKTNIKGKPMFSLHRHVKAGSIPCLAFDSLALETTFRMMKINFNVRYDVKKLNKPAYINHEGYLLTGVKKVLHYLNLRSKMGIDGHLTAVENSTVRAFSTMLIDQTNFIVDFYRYQENFEDWKDVVRDSNHVTSKENALKIIKNKKKSHKFIKQRMYSLGFYNWCEEGIKSVAKEDFKNLSQLLGDKQFFMGDVPCVLDCVAFAVISNIICSNHNNPLVGIVKNDCANLVSHYERVKELLWSDWTEQLNAKPTATNTTQSSSTRPKSFSYKRLSFRNRYKRSKSGSVRSANVGSNSTNAPTTNKDPKTAEASNTAIATKSSRESNTIELNTKDDLPGGAISSQATNGVVEGDLLNSTAQIETAKSPNPSPANEQEPTNKAIRASFYHNFANKCNLFRKSKKKQTPPTTPTVTDQSVASPSQQPSNVCTCGSNKNSATITPTPTDEQNQLKTNNQDNQDDVEPAEPKTIEDKHDDDDFADALEDTLVTAVVQPSQS